MYGKIKSLAESYYRKGREGDIEHICWLEKKLFELRKIIEDNGYDFDVIFALTILHDVGYAKLPKGYNPFDLGIRRLHAEKSAEIADDIFKRVNFPKSKRRKTLRLIKHHDDWALGKPPKDPEWRIFTDLDFSWEASSSGFDIVRKFLKQNRKQFLKTVQDHYKRKQKNNPFFLRESKKMFLKDLRYWKQKLN